MLRNPIRFVFSNSCLADGAADSSTGLITGASKRYQAMVETALAQRALRARTFSRPQCTRPVPNDMPISLAIDIFWAELLDELAKENIEYEKITFRHSQARLEELPASCDGKIPSADSIRDYLAAIPTNLGIDKCSADLLEMAAHQLVHARFDARQ